MSGTQTMSPSRRPSHSSLASVLRALVWCGALALLFTPWLAMQFTDEVNWTALDFVVMGCLLALAGAGFEAALRTSPSWTYFLGASVAIGAAFLMTWANLAVGLIGDGMLGVNALFLLPPLVVIGALASRWRCGRLAQMGWALAAFMIAMGLLALGLGDAPGAITCLCLGAAFAVSAVLLGRDRG